MSDSTPYYSDEHVVLHHGDCLDVMRTLPDNSVDAVVTDPPYGIGFMGKVWDHQAIREAVERDHATRKNLGPDSDSRPGRAAPRSSSAFGDAAIIAGPVTGGLPFQQWCESWARECLRVLKPGGHLLAFGGTRTSHRLACGVEDAGFEMRDSIAWLYGSGFPKSLDVSKAIDKAAGAQRETVGPSRWAEKGTVQDFGIVNDDGWQPSPRTDTAPATPDAAKWQGWGTALKPAFEPVVVGRKPLVGTVAANVLAYGTGALNIAACRVPGEAQPFGNGTKRTAGIMGASEPRGAWEPTVSGRWPTNVALDDTQAAELDRQSGVSTSRANDVSDERIQRESSSYGIGQGRRDPTNSHTDSGGASRFFPTFSHHECEVCGEDTTGWHRDARDEHALAHEGKPFPTFHYEAKAPTSERPRHDGTAHPTVKPLDLMRWLVRLVTPPGGTVLEPFAGSGTTAEACVIEGFKCIAIEREATYLPLIMQRLSKDIAVTLDFGGEAS